MWIAGRRWEQGRCLRSTAQRVPPQTNGDGESIDLDEAEIEVRLQAKAGWTAAQGQGVVVVLATELTPELLAEGLARDFIRVIQDLRKEQDCEFTDKIDIGLVTESEDLQAAVEHFRDYIAGETLAASISFQAIDGLEPMTVNIGGHEAHVYLRVVR